MITDPTPEEVNRALDSTLEGIRLRNLYRPREDGEATRRFAVHLVERLRQYGRLTLCMAYEEADTFVVRGDEVLAGPAIPDLETMISVLATLHCYHAVHNSNIARDLDGDRLETNLHWTSGMDLTAGRDFNTHTPLHFRIDPGYAEITLRFHQRRLRETLAAENRPPFKALDYPPTSFWGRGNLDSGVGVSARVQAVADAYEQTADDASDEG